MASQSVICAFLLTIFSVNVNCKNAASSVANNLENYTNIRIDVVETLTTPRPQFERNRNSTFTVVESSFTSTAEQLQNSVNPTFEIVKTSSTLMPDSIENDTDILVDTSTARYVRNNRNSTATSIEASLYSAFKQVGSSESSTFTTSTSATETEAVHLNPTLDLVTTLVTSKAGQLQNNINVTFEIGQTSSTSTASSIENHTDILVESSTAQLVAGIRKSMVTSINSSSIFTSEQVESSESLLNNTLSTLTTKSEEGHPNSTLNFVQTLATSTPSRADSSKNFTSNYRTSPYVGKRQISTESFIETSTTSTIKDIQSYENATVTFDPPLLTSKFNYGNGETNSTFANIRAFRTIIKSAEGNLPLPKAFIKGSSNLTTQLEKTNQNSISDFVKFSPKSFDILTKCFEITMDLIQTESVQLLLRNVLESSQILESCMAAIANIVGVFSNNLRKSDQPETLNDLRVIDRKLDMLRSEIEHILADISLQISFDQIATQVNQLNSVKGQYSEWLKYAENLTEARTQRFSSSCEQNVITDKPNLFYRIFVGKDDVRRPREQVIGFGATKKYQKFASSMVAYLLQASLLSGVCTGLQGNTTDIKVTIQQDAAIYGGYLLKAITVIISDDLLIKSRFWVNALSDMNKYLNDYTGRSHSEFAKAFHQHLTDKFDYREWLVISYGDNKFYGEKYHWCYPKSMTQVYNSTDRSTFFHNIVRTGDRNVILASPNTIRPSFYPEMFSLLAKACFKQVNLCPENVSYAYEVGNRLKECPMGPRFDPIISFVFKDQSGYEIVNNSPLTASRWMEFKTVWSRYQFVSVLIA